MRRLDRRQRRGLGAALLGVAAVGAFLVFSPAPTVASGVIQSVARLLERLGFRYGEAAPAVEFLLNVALFAVPVFVAALLWRSVAWWRWVLLGLGVSICIETVQAVFLAGRTPQARDLVSNTLGAALGAGLARVVASRLPVREAARR